MFLHYKEFDHSVNTKVLENRIIFPMPLTLHQLGFRATSYAQNTKQWRFLPKSNALSCSGLPVMSWFISKRHMTPKMYQKHTKHHNTVPRGKRTKHVVKTKIFEYISTHKNIVYNEKRCVENTAHQITPHLNVCLSSSKSTNRSL